MNKVVSSLNKVIEWVLILLFLLLVVDVVWQVFSRYIIGKSSSFTEEFARFALMWLVVLGAAYLNGKKAHLTMDFFLKKLSKKRKLRREKIIEGLMLLFAFVVMVIGGGNLVYTTLILGQDSPAMNIPLGYIYAIVPISGIIIILYSLNNIIYPKTAEI